jgi:RNA polymerase-binding protein DksA
MIQALSDKQRDELKQKLQHRFNELSERVRQELQESDNEQYLEIAGKVHDLEEASLADLLVDIDLAIIDLHIEEIQDIEKALMRFPMGSYGICIDCGTDISYKRLQANPAAKRCLDCQAKDEWTYAEGHPTL